MNVLRNLVPKVMFHVDPELLKGHCPNCEKPKTKGYFTSKELVGYMPRWSCHALSE